MLRKLATDLLKTLESNPETPEESPLNLEITPDGMRISVFDRNRKPIFEADKAEFTPYGSWIFSTLAWEISRYTNSFSIELEGHTEKGRPSPNADYGDWELSADRANAARRMLLTHDVVPTQIRKVADNYQLLKAIDHNKDQSYFLYRLNQAQLSKTMFPLGLLLKSQVREIARQHRLSNYAKKDSTGICFIGKRPFREFLNRYLPAQPGPMYTPDGQIVGEHMGLSFYTIGQRQGLGIGGQGLPWFVAAKNIANNHLIVAQGHDHPALLSTFLDATELHWIDNQIPDITRNYTAKIRYRQADVSCHFNAISDTLGSIEFNEAQWAVTPGQSVVIYDGEICLGGGTIAHSQ